MSVRPSVCPMYHTLSEKCCGQAIWHTILVIHPSTLSIPLLWKEIQQFILVSFDLDIFIYFIYLWEDIENTSMNSYLESWYGLSNDTKLVIYGVKVKKMKICWINLISHFQMIELCCVVLFLCSTPARGNVVCTMTQLTIVFHCSS